MWEEHKILQKFIGYVREHVKIIEAEIKKGDMKEALLWFDELRIMSETRGNILTAIRRQQPANFARPFDKGLLTEEKRRLFENAEAESEIVKTAIRDASYLIKSAKG